ncbi:hypothetical protein P7C70_g5355, partial [Phenoliferia sp. Uapishka_3]
MNSIKRSTSRKSSNPHPDASPHSLAREVSHGVPLQRPLSAEDDITFPAFTTAGPHTDAFQEETATGLVDAAEVESPLTQSSSRTHVGGDAEKGEKLKGVKLVTWLEGDPENPLGPRASRVQDGCFLSSLICFALYNPFYYAHAEEITNANVTLLGLGPPIGGYIAMYTSWRWIYWVLLIFVGVCTVWAFFFLKESYSPVLLTRRAKKMRAETGDESIMTEQELHKRPAGDLLQEALVRPLDISANTYLVDAFSRYSASAMAAKTFIRSMAGASMPMWISYMYARLGNHWAGSLMAFVAVGMLPIPFVFFWHGARIRAMSKRATA